MPSKMVTIAEMVYGILYGSPLGGTGPAWAEYWPGQYTRQHWATLLEAARRGEGR